MMTKNIMTEKRTGKASLGNKKTHYKDKEKRIGKASLEKRQPHWKGKRLRNKIQIIQIINYYIFTFTMEINE